MSRLATCLVTLLALPLSACSFTMAGPRSSTAVSRKPVCAADSINPGIDYGAAALIALGGTVLSAVRTRDQTCDSAEPCSTFDKKTLLVTGVLASVFLISGIHGSMTLRNCERAQRQYEASVRFGPRPTTAEGIRRYEQQRGRLEKQRAKQQQQRIQSICNRWKAELAQATTVEEKLAVARRRPEICRD